MTIIAREGEKIKGRDGKHFATVAKDIHSGDVNIRADQFVMADGTAPELGAFIPEEVYEFIRDRLGNPPPEPTAEPKAKPAKGKAKR